MFNAIKVNKWKWLFWLLAIINVGVIAWLVFLVYVPSNTTTIPEDDPIQGKQAEFTLQSTTNNINEIINSYLIELSKGEPLKYSVSLEDSVELRGTIIAFEKEIPLTMKFEPKVQQNGDLMLEQTSITLGRLQLPNRKVLDYIRDNYPMPDWVIVNPDEESIYVAFTKIKAKYGLKVKAKAFDLEKNQIAFKVTVPHETLGLGKSTWLKNFMQKQTELPENN
ncbi:YpmS family protein [Pontibacillus yanchengensis]|uniref:DUF2140 domain-containing protein n=1 Tax=Pontibacillus yanchengensis Y32 TaxID=1385514 RepID=A0A0A2TXR6_9BACI|nr:YpmS family protein [Pontibacillus yanchengensis]KGP74065.1 hypothetical protein N782_17140 [Pontibacillus yanchengensis Y32]